MPIVDSVKERMGATWLPLIYKERVRSQRSRAYGLEVPNSQNEATIQHTLLGIELKVRKVRISCPDLATARYLRVFARIGCQNVAVPYDITRISSIADELESSWQESLLRLDELIRGKSAPARGRIRAALVRTLREEILEIGSGDKMPNFEIAGSASN